MGGGGFTMEPGNFLLDDYVLKQSGVEKPRICFLPTASGDHPDYIRMFYDFFQTRACFPTHLSVIEPATDDFETFLLDQDIIYVGGGHTGRMLAVWKSYKIDSILKKAWIKGILIAGVSAGAACWFEEAVTDSVPGKLTPEKCLGFLKGSFCAHYDSDKRRPTFHKYIRSGETRSGFGVENSVALHFVGHEIKRVVASVTRADAYFVKKENDHTIEKRLFTHYLGDTEF